MDSAKRYHFCGHKLNSEGYCENKNCSDYLRKKFRRVRRKKCGMKL